MVYPAIPLTGFWDDSQTFVQNPIEVSTQEGGLTTRDYRNFINTTRETWRVSGNVRNGLELDTFLKERMFEPFLFAPNPDAVNKKTFVCKDWSITLLSNTTIGGDRLWKFSATFEEVFRA